MIVPLELAQTIYENLETMATDKGITVAELLRWIVGEYVGFSNQRTRISLPVPLPAKLDESGDRVLKVGELLVKTVIAQGVLKCPGCTLPLDVEAITQGKCQNCGTEL